MNGPWAIVMDPYDDMPDVVGPFTTEAEADAVAAWIYNGSGDVAVWVTRLYPAPDLTGTP